MHGDRQRPAGAGVPRAGTHHALTRVLVTVLLGAALVTCGQQEPANERSPSPPSSPPSPPSSPSSSAKTGFDGIMVSFVQLAIATGDQAVKLLDQGAQQASSPALRELAADLAKVRRAEVTTLHGILEEVSVPYVNPHVGHDMPGMPTDAELTALAAPAPASTRSSPACCEHT